MLKSNGRVTGKKRAAKQDSSDSEGKSSAPKKSKVSSNISSTCKRMGSILLNKSSVDSSLSVNNRSEDVFEREKVDSGDDGRANNIVTVDGGLHASPRKNSGNFVVGSSCKLLVKSSGSQNRHY